VVAGVRVLLTEGSSLRSREVVSCLGPLGYHLEVLDPDALCLARHSRWGHRVHRCPPAGREPLAYVDFLTRTVAERAIEAVLPTHEQAWLLAAARRRLPDDLPVAVAHPKAFARVQSKLSFAALLDALGLPQPPWRPVTGAGDVEDLAYPYWLKAPFSTAGRGVREVTDAATRDRALAELLGAGETAVMAQQPARGQYGQAAGLFDTGRLIAAHTSVGRAVGMGGSAAARLSVDHPVARRHLARLGEVLQWHGGLTLDYLHVEGSPVFLECNPRTVEPANAAAAGLNIPDLQVRLSQGETLGPSPSLGVAGIRTHGLIAVLMGIGGRGGSRLRLLAELRDASLGCRLYAHSTEQLTPITRDPLSLLPAVILTSRLLWAPSHAERIARAAIDSYSITPATIEAAS